MMAGFKKYSVDHDALFNEVRSNRYAKDKPAASPEAETPPIPKQPEDRSDAAPAPPVMAVEDRQGPAAKEGATPSDPAPVPPKVSAKPSPKEPAVTTNSVAIRVRVRFPAPGVSAKFDAMAAQLGEEEAFRAVFRAAFENYRKRLDEGRMPEGPKSYPAGKHTYRSNKVMTPGQFKVVSDALNPMGLVPPSTLGRMIAERALALFFQKDRQADT